MRREHAFDQKTNSLFLSIESSEQVGRSVGQASQGRPNSIHVQYVPCTQRKVMCSIGVGFQPAAACCYPLSHRPIGDDRASHITMTTVMYVCTVCCERWDGQTERQHMMRYAMRPGCLEPKGPATATATATATAPSRNAATGRLRITSEGLQHTSTSRLLARSTSLLFLEARFRQKGGPKCKAQRCRHARHIC